MGGKDTAMCPSEFFLRMTGDKRKSGWTDIDVHRYLRMLKLRSLIKKFTFKRIQTFLGQYYFPLGRIFTHSKKGNFVRYKNHIRFRSLKLANIVLSCLKNEPILLKEGCFDNRIIMRFLKAYSYNTEEEGWYDYSNLILTFRF